jgi:glycine/D-amino acid oxidase-like deaminating enzyme
MSIAIIGAGVQGCCAALELASRGRRVELFERADLPMTGASRWNEGKIHLGYVYAKDDTLATAKAMLSGSFVFGRVMERLLEHSIGSDIKSSPFIYAVHRDSMIPAERIESYFSRLDELIAGWIAYPQYDYLGAKSLQRCRVLPVERHFAPEGVQKAFACPELSIDTRSVADRIVNRVLTDPRITFNANATVTSVERRSRDGFALHLADGRRVAEFDHVINASWQSRLAIDRTLGYRPHRRWLHRYKTAVHLRNRHDVLDLPSVTFLLGPFGDAVNFGNGQYYFSWYPVCCLALSSQLLPPDYGPAPEPLASAKIAQDAMAALTMLIPKLAGLDIDATNIEVRGSWIFAWGASDIFDIDSELHTRHDVGVFSDRGFHTINTGKYGMAPLHALTVSDRITGLR